MVEIVTNSAGQNIVSISQTAQRNAIPVASAANPTFEIEATPLLLSDDGVISQPVVFNRRIVSTPDIERVLTLVENVDTLTIDLEGTVSRSDTYYFEHTINNLKIAIINFSFSTTEVVKFNIIRQHDGTTNILNIDWANSTLNGNTGAFNVLQTPLNQNPSGFNNISFFLENTDDVSVAVTGSYDLPVIPLADSVPELIEVDRTVSVTRTEPPTAQQAIPLSADEIPVFESGTVVTSSGVTLTGTERNIFGTLTGDPVITDGLINRGYTVERRTTLTISSGSLVIDLVTATASNFEFQHTVDNLILEITAPTNSRVIPFTLIRIKDTSGANRGIDWANSTINGQKNITPYGQPLGQNNGDRNIIGFYTKDGLSYQAQINLTKPGA